jgi:F-type H+-transporting ATPase subunit b
MVSINVAVILVQLITFIVGMWLVWNTMIKALMNTLKERDTYIKNSLEKVEKDKAEMAAMKDDYEKKVHEMHTKTAAALNKAVADGEKIKDSLLEEAKTEGAKLLSEAKKEIELEKVKAIEAVKDTIVDISMIAAEKAIRKKITKKDQVTLVNDYLKEIGKSSN